MDQAGDVDWLGLTVASMRQAFVQLGTATGDAVWLEGHDAGVSFASLHEPSSSITYTVISNWSEGAWPITKLLNERLGA